MISEKKGDGTTSLQKFFNCLGEWKNTLDKMMQLEIIARNRMNTLAEDDTNDALLKFIKRILDNKFSLLHLRMIGLLNYLNSSILEKTLSELAALPIAPWPQKIGEGDYLAYKPKDEIHDACLTLLNNNSKACNNNSYWDLANSILQATLQIYEDTRDILEQDRIINFDVSTDFPEEENGHRYCVCM